MTRNQIKWASTHDWYIGCNLHSGVVYVRDDSISAQAIIFDNIHELRAWAGY
ncbi:MAG: hypothetical protein ACTSYH_03390 [Candidatus Heimdallarchaeaceae archaeon]